MELTYRYRLYPTEKQGIDIRRTCSAVRFLYNRLLEERTNTYRETGKWAKFNTEYYRLLPWMVNVDPGALMAAENQLRNAYKHFFHILRTKPDVYRPESLKRAQADQNYQLMDSDLVGYPQFKKKKTTAESYQTPPEKVELQENAVVLPVIGRVRARMHRPLPEDAEIVKCTVLKKRSGRFYILLLIQVPDVVPEKQMSRPLGVVFSPGRLILRSDGKPVEFRHTDPALEKRIQKAYQTLQRRTPGSRRYEKQREYMAKLYEKRVEQRKDDLHKATRQIANDADVVLMEAPEVLDRTPMLKRLGLYDTVHDEAWWKFSKMVQQKVRAEGHLIWMIPRRDPHFGMCAKCGFIQRPVLSGKKFDCPVCWKVSDREENAAKVLCQEAADIIKRDAGA